MFDPSQEIFGTTLEGFLAALQLADSFYPTGMYAHSHGLEGMVHRGMIRTPSDVEDFLRNQLRWAVLPSDGVAVLNAHRAASHGDLNTLLAMDRMLHALKSPAELRAGSTHVGRRLIAETSHLTLSDVAAAFRGRVTDGESPGNAAVALGVVSQALDIPEMLALTAFCHSHSISVVGAALRLLPVTHTAVQDILHRLHPLIAEGARSIGDRPWQEMTAFTPELDIVSMNHESDDLRLFAS